MALNSLTVLMCR